MGRRRHTLPARSARTPPRRDICALVHDVRVARRSQADAETHGPAEQILERSLMAHDTEREQAVGKLAALIRQTRIGMLTTLTEEGAFRSRPVTTHGARFDGDPWFLTRVDSAKLDQVRQHRRVGLTYAEPTHNTYVSLSGTAQVVLDRAKAEELWDPSYQGWFPGGPSDPDLALIKVTVERAEYWAAPALTWPLSAGFVVMASDQRDDPWFHASIVLDPRDRPAAPDPEPRA